MLPYFFLKFSYWSKFRVNIITSSRVMAIFLYKGLTGNLEVGNTSILSNIWRRGKLVIPNLSRMSLMTCYWMLKNARFTVFTVSVLLTENYQGLVKLTPVHSTLWKFSLHFIHIFRGDWMFLNKFGSSNPSFSRSILTLLYLQAQIAVIH